jgi:hypothetical protein
MISEPLHNHAGIVYCRELLFKFYTHVESDGVKCEVSLWWYRWYSNILYRGGLYFAVLKVSFLLPVEVITKRRSHISVVQISCQNNVNESTSVKYLSRKCKKQSK